MKLFSLKDMPNFAGVIRTSICIPRSLSLLKMILNCAVFILPTAHAHDRVIDVTSYAEVVLASSDSDALHPAFSNLFVQTEIIRERHAILCTRRPRSPEDQTLWMFHMMAVRGAKIEEVSFETDRMQFIGRGNTINASSSNERVHGTFKQSRFSAGSDCCNQVSYNTRTRRNGNNRYDIRAR